MINDVKVKSFHSNVQYMYDFCIPCDTKEAHKLDEENSNDNGRKVIQLEIQQLMDYNAFIDIG